MATAGYSGTPLPKKLGIREGDVVALVDEPDDLRAVLGLLPSGVELRSDIRARPDVAVTFFRRRAALARRLPALGRAIFPAASLWVAWPKRASGVATDITEDVVRELALPLGLVDVKVCAIDQTWSGLKLVWRKERR